MQDLNGKVTDGTLTAVEWNEVPSEMQNIIEATTYAQTLSSGDLDQLGKGVSGYAASATFYTGSGTANAHIATKLAGLQAPPNYGNGMVVRFRPSNANTAGATINVDSLGVKTIKKEDGTVLSAGDLGTDRDAWLRYDGTDFLLSNWAASSIILGERVGHLVRTDADTITLHPGGRGIIAIDVDGVRLTRSASLAFDFGDLDTGGEASSTAYYLYIDNLAGVMDPVVSIDPPTPLDGGGKVGYHPTRTDEVCIGGVWNDVGSDFVEFIHMPDGTIMLLSHDGDHEHTLATAAATSWRNETVNIPETSMSVLFCASAKTTTNDGMVVFGKDGATGTLGTGDTDPKIIADVMLFAINSGATDAKGYSVVGEIPIVDRTTPAISYGMTDAVTVHSMIINGYRDIFAPHF